MRSATRSFLVSLLLLVLVGSGMVFAESKIRIGISIGTLKQERWQREIDMFKAFAKANGVELLIQSAEDDAAKQVSQCENLITQGVNVLIVQALDSEGVGVVVGPAHQAGIPVIAYDRQVRNGDLDYYITFDSVKVGETEAKFVVNKVPKGNYIWLLGGPEDFNAHLVFQGQKNVLQPYIDRGDIKIVLQQWTKGWDPDVAMKNAENGLTLAGNNVQAIIASNDGTARRGHSGACSSGVGRKGTTLPVRMPISQLARESLKEHRRELSTSRWQD